MIGTILNLFRSAPIPAPVIDPPPRITPLTPEQAVEKMLSNGKKAILEHQKISSVFASATQAIPSIEQLQRKEATVLKLQHTFADHIGPRHEMQDAHFYVEIEQGTLIGVFDGHGPQIGGKEVSNYACQEFQKRFSTVLKAHNGDVFRAFEVLIHEIHQEIAKKPEWNSQGSTAVISFIDKETHQIITATLGDSEANLYRNGSSIPLSTVRDWTCKKDQERLIKAYGPVAQMYIKANSKKAIRSKLNVGVNVSRAIGDIDETGTREKPLVIHKPKITINKLQKGDVLILACDGLKDYVPEKEIVAKVFKNAWTISNIVHWIFDWIRIKIFCGKPKEELPLAQDLVNHAIHTRKAYDNVTVIAVEVS